MFLGGKIYAYLNLNWAFGTGALLNLLAIVYFTASPWTTTVKINWAWILIDFPSITPSFHHSRSGMEKHQLPVWLKASRAATADSRPGKYCGTARPAPDE